MSIEVALSNIQNRTFTLRGTCPHGSHESAFILAGGVHIDQSQKWIAAMQCQGCGKYILAIMYLGKPGNVPLLYYQEHYPLGKPDDSVALEIPDSIQPDFKEALRCRFVDAYNATAEMCRRALEASCIDLGASPKGVLEDMIDEVEEKRIITPFLRQVAHKIRLGGNRGAHPSPPTEPKPAPPVGLGFPEEKTNEPIRKIGKDHADAIIKFTREFFHHVYVVPKELEKYDFSKPKP
jgi:hypothetical protein